MKSISLFVDNGTYLTKIHPFTKLMYVIVAILIPLIGGEIWMFPCTIIVSLCILASGKILKRAFPLIAFAFTIVLVIFIIHGMFNQRNETVWFAIGKLTFYKEGSFRAIKTGLNIFNMLFSFAIFVLSTKPSEFVDELEKRGFSPKFGYIIISVFQIVPLMTGTMSTITDAQRSRGLETEGKLLTRAKAFLPLISPVVMSTLINTRERAIALEVRGFASKNRKTWLYERPKHKGDTPITICLGFCLFAMIVWRVVSCLLLK